MALAMRDLNAHLRETGEIKGYNASFASKDRSRFLGEMEKLMDDARHEGRLTEERRSVCRSA